MRYKFNRMKQAGRASLVSVLGVVGIFAVAVLFFVGGESPTAATGRFMSALARSDVQALTDMSYMPGNDRESVQKKWEYTTQVAGKYYQFKWKTLNEVRTSDSTAAVNVHVWRNFKPDNPASYEEKFGVPLVQKDGKWLVEVRGLTRGMYPGLPR